MNDLKPCECSGKAGWVSCAASMCILAEGYYCRFNPPPVELEEQKSPTDRALPVQDWAPSTQRVQL